MSGILVAGVGNIFLSDDGFGVEVVRRLATKSVPEGVTVISALHTVNAAALAEGDPVEQDVLIFGDRKADKARVAELVERIEGLRAVNAGALEMARIAETLTSLLIAINFRYKSRAGIRITGLPQDDHWA